LHHFFYFDTLRLAFLPSLDILRMPMLFLRHVLQSLVLVAVSATLTLAPQAVQAQSGAGIKKEQQRKAGKASKSTKPKKTVARKSARVAGSGVKSAALRVEPAHCLADQAHDRDDHQRIDAVDGRDDHHHPGRRGH
jgi:hypothetical protein